MLTKREGGVSSAMELNIDVYSLPNGRQVKIEWPDQLGSDEEVQDITDWMYIIVRKIGKRRILLRKPFFVDTPPMDNTPPMAQAPPGQDLIDKDIAALVADDEPF